jgi:hypothetical protein
LQTVTEIAAENNSTTLFPIPLDLFRPFMDAAPRGAIAAPVIQPGVPTVDAALLAAPSPDSQSMQEKAQPAAEPHETLRRS